MKAIIYSKIAIELKQNKEKLNSGEIDIYDFIDELSIKYSRPLNTQEWDMRMSLLFAICDIEGIELY
jgi:hypothetical protein